MSEDRIRRALHGEPVPDSEGAEARAWEVVRAAYAERSPASRGGAPARLALALAGAAVLAALLLSPAGAAVREWIKDVVEPGEEHPAPALTSLPAPGRLLVESKLGPWIVESDGSKRLLGAYDEAAWSPNGRFAAVANGRELLAVVADVDAVGEPEGTVRWASPDVARPVRDPAWGPSGVRVAYRAGGELRVIRGDGVGDHRLAGGVAPVEPAWRPLSRGELGQVDPDTGIAAGARNVIAYVDSSQRVRVVDADTGRQLWSARTGLPVNDIDWSRFGRRLVITGEGFSLILDRHGRPSAKLPTGGSEVSFAPGGGRIALLERGLGAEGLRSDVLLFGARGGAVAERHLYGGPGRLADLTWSPDGRWVLVAWPGADQWVFVAPRRGSAVRAVAGITEEFKAGARGRATFPRVSGWLGG